MTTVCFSKELLTRPYIPLVLKDHLTFQPFLFSPKGRQALLWGDKRKSRKGKMYCRLRKLPFVYIEEGFLAYPKGERDIYSFIIDDVGLYYDANKPSRLENNINDGDLSESQLILAERLMTQVLTKKMSKYNTHHINAPLMTHTKTDKLNVLVVDQTENDASVYLGMADKNSFKRMLEAAIDENPNANIIVKIHPRATKAIAEKKSYCLPLVQNYQHVCVLDKPCHPMGLLPSMDKVYTVSSQLGFEAMMLKKPVRCFGMPFYAGWGLSEDEIRLTRRTVRCSLLELFYHAYIDYPVYIHPKTKVCCHLSEYLQA